MRVYAGGLVVAVGLISMSAALQASTILGPGFSGWTIPTGSPGSVVSTQTLTATFNGYSIVSTSNLQVTPPASGGNVTTNNVADVGLTGISGTPHPAQVWIAFLFQDDYTTAHAGNQGLIWLNNSLTANHSTGTGIGDTVVGGVMDGRAKLGTGTAVTGTSIASGQTYLFVGELTLNSAGTAYTQLKVWIDPAGISSLSGTPTLTATGSLPATDLTYIGVRSVLGTGNTLYFGNVTVGTTYGDILPTPEPSAFALTGIGLLGLLLLRRRAR